MLQSPCSGWSSGGAADCSNKDDAYCQYIFGHHSVCNRWSACEFNTDNHACTYSLGGGSGGLSGGGFGGGGIGIFGGIGKGDGGGSGGVNNGDKNWPYL